MESNYTVREMDRENALEILKWRYDEEYRMYNENSGEDDINEMISGSCLAVFNRQDEAVGFFCYGESARARDVENTGVYDDGTFTDFGLGMRPDLCGKGMGEEFMKLGLATGEIRSGIRKFRLSVDASNLRAIRLYEKCGFVQKETFRGVYNGIEAIFAIMRLET